MAVIKGDSQHDLRTYRFEDGYTLQENMLLRALKMQAQHGMLMTNPRKRGYYVYSKRSVGAGRWLV